MASILDPDLRRALAERVRYCHEMGIYDFYRRESSLTESSSLKSALSESNAIDLPSAESELELREEMAARKSAASRDCCRG